MHNIFKTCILTKGLGKPLNDFVFFFMVFFQKGGGGSLPIQKFWVTFFCPEAIKSKQMPMCQKAKNSEKVIFEMFC